ncbi:hypothetical protein SAMN05660653_00414 [Desulfonatronum thiosulfatophilum]|uniref:Uncharacterized protein n=1 Tax=Desulfonatronum thiosulfatophilum TaxID=617002 RepID=A0A1G6AJR7_9BACT|nr:DUF6785 family protein [Desulfonatronum thiosulfatophilum]SDB08642.1 hypothetical protein SAMN05660653_00414 [Desulfonatronum thiosulfatophilum]
MTEVVRPRAFIVGLVLGLILCVITPYNSAYLHNTSLGGGHFPLAPFFIAAWLFVFSAFTGWLRKGPGVFSGNEVLTMWVFMVVFSGVSYAGLAQTFFINITAPFYFAADGFRWAESLQPLLPGAWYPDAAEGGAGFDAVRTIYDGLDGGWDMSWTEVLRSIHWDVWVGPLITWSAFVLLCFFVMFCLMALLGKQWVVNERITFPLLRVPQLMGEALDNRGMGAFFRDRFLLVGLLSAAVLHLLNGLHFYFPHVPELPTLILAGGYFPKYGLFSGFYNLRIYIFPAFIAFAFLAPRQISFSFWFFYLLAGLGTGLLYVSGLQFPQAALGATFGADFARPEEAQTIGAYLIFFLFILWLARTHLRQQAALMFRSRKRTAEGEGSHDRESDRDNWETSGWPMWGLLVGGLCLIWWCWSFGLPMVAAVLVPLAFFLVLIVSSRIIVQGGLPIFPLTAAPMDGLIGTFGSGFLGNAGLLATAVMQKVLFLSLRESLLPTLFHSAKVSENVRNRRVWFAVLGGTLVVAVVLSFVTMLALSYRYGVRDMDMDWATSSTIAAYENVQRLLDVPTGPNEWIVSFAGVGALIMLFLVFMYYRVTWWSLHPIGYLTAYSTGMQMLWFSFFVGWLCNRLCLRYGGTSLFNQVRFFFVGLVLGDFLMGGIWALVGMFAGTSYQVFPL